MDLNTAVARRVDEEMWCHNPWRQINRDPELDSTIKLTNCFVLAAAVKIVV